MHVTQPSLVMADASEAAPFDTSIGALLVEAAQRCGNREAVIYACHDELENVRWTYADLDAAARHLAGALLNAGYAPGDRLAIWGPNHFQWIKLLFACAKAGLVIVALNPLYKAHELSFALQTAGAKGIFYAERIGGQDSLAIINAVRASVPTLKGVHSFTDGVAHLEASYHGNCATIASHADDPFMIQYTSGTTGLPKAAQLSHRSVATVARNTFNIWGFGEGDRICNGFPLFHIGGSGIFVNGAMCAGAAMAPLYVFKARRTLDIFEQERCTGFMGVPSMLIAMMEDKSFASRDLSHLKRIIVGGAPVPMELLKRCEDAFSASVTNSYGQTESSGVITSTTPADSAERKTQSCGRPLPGVSLKVIGADQKITETGRPGELCYKGPGLMLGYLDADATSATIDSEGWLHTGDLAEMDAEGYVRIVGRLKDIIIRGGENISPAEVENLLLRHPHVAEAAVFGLPDEKHGEIVCAALRPSHSEHDSPEDVRKWCLENISRWKAPEVILFVDAFPMTSSGKVQKFRLREQMHLMNPTRFTR